jgi:hypothetical protein
MEHLYFSMQRRKHETTGNGTSGHTLECREIAVIPIIRIRVQVMKKMLSPHVTCGANHTNINTIPTKDNRYAVADTAIIGSRLQP